MSVEHPDNINSELMQDMGTFSTNKSFYFRIMLMLRLHTCSAGGLFLNETHLAPAEAERQIVGGVRTYINLHVTVAPAFPRPYDAVMLTTPWPRCDTLVCLDLLQQLVPSSITERHTHGSRYSACYPSGFSESTGQKLSMNNMIK